MNKQYKFILNGVVKSVAAPNEWKAYRKIRLNFPEEVKQITDIRNLKLTLV